MQSTCSKNKLQKERKRGPLGKSVTTLVSEEKSSLVLGRITAMPCRGQKNGPFGHGGPGSRSSWGPRGRKHGWDVITLISLSLSWLCCWCYWWLVERLRFQTSDQRPLILPQTSDLVCPFHSLLTPTVMFSKARMVIMSLRLLLWFQHRLLQRSVCGSSTLLSSPHMTSSTVDPATWLSHCLQTQHQWNQGHQCLPQNSHFFLFLCYYHPSGSVQLSSYVRSGPGQEEAVVH